MNHTQKPAEVTTPAGETKPKPGYYAIIPASVRYDDTLPPNAKLLYGEITALCSMEGFCWASNRYFAELYDVKIRAVQIWIKALEDGGHILVDAIDGYKRHIRLPEAERAARVKKDTPPPHAKKDIPPCKKAHGGMTQMTRGHVKKDTHSITSSTTTNKTKNSEISPSAVSEQEPPIAASQRGLLVADSLFARDRRRKKGLQKPGEEA